MTDTNFSPAGQQMSGNGSQGQTNTQVSNTPAANGTAPTNAQPARMPAMMERFLGQSAKEEAVVVFAKNFE